MNRSRQFYEFVEELKSKDWGYGFSHFLEQHLDFLHTHRDYIDHVNSTFGSAFAHLSRDIIQDVVDLIGSEGPHETTGLNELRQLEGPWKDAAASVDPHTYISCVSYSDFKLALYKHENYSDGKEITVADSGQLAIRKTKVCPPYDHTRWTPAQLEALAPRMYDTLNISMTHKLKPGFFRKLGNRFSHITLHIDHFVWRAEDLKFVKRQLNSRCLQIFHLIDDHNVGLPQPIFDSLRPHFEAFLRSSQFVCLAFSLHVPFPFLKRLHASLKDQTFLSHDHHVSAAVDKDTGEKLKTCFSMTNNYRSWEGIEDHPASDEWEIRITLMYGRFRIDVQRKQENVQW